jgi:hypothetical protein
MKKHLRSTAVALTLAMGLSLSSGCYGQFGLTRRLYAWNGEASPNRFVNSAIMWGLVIIPVYALAGIADFAVFNVVEFWGGSNPVAQQTPQGDLKLKYAGHDFEIRQVGKEEVEVHRDGRASFRYYREGNTLVLTDLKGRTIKTVDMQTQVAQARPLSIL